MKGLDLWLAEQSQLSNQSLAYSNNCQGSDMIPIAPDVFDLCMIAYTQLTNTSTVFHDNITVQALIIQGKSNATFGKSWALPYPFIIAEVPSHSQFNNGVSRFNIRWTSKRMERDRIMVWKREKSTTSRGQVLLQFWLLLAVWYTSSFSSSCIYVSIDRHNLCIYNDTSYVSVHPSGNIRGYFYPLCIGCLNCLSSQSWLGVGRVSILSIHYQPMLPTLLVLILILAMIFFSNRFESILFRWAIFYYPRVLCQFIYSLNHIHFNLFSLRLSAYYLSVYWLG